jgi:ribosomal protein S18 acetylase RimI-like enzyme
LINVGEWDTVIVLKHYTHELDELELGSGFFEGWPNPPSEEMHRRILKESYLALVAVDTETNQVVGFVNAISDGVLSAYIPLLEVLPVYRNQGIGANLVRTLLDELQDLYMIDLCCDQELQSYYVQLGMIKSYGMIYRNYRAQSGKSPSK